MLVEKERFEMEEAEALATPVNVVENSVPVTTDENKSSMQHDHFPTFINSNMAELMEQADDYMKTDPIHPSLPNLSGVKEKKDYEITDQEQMELEANLAQLEDVSAEEIFYGDDSNAPSTRKEMLKFEKKKGKLSSAISKLGRKK